MKNEKEDLGFQSRISSVLSCSYSPSGDESVIEDIKTQLANEKFVESVYAECVHVYGRMHFLSMEIFFKLLDIYIGLYRLDKCDELLRSISPYHQLPNDTYIKLIQAKAFTKWKQGKFSDAIKLFREMESLLSQQGKSSIELYENMAHTYSAIGEYGMAEEYFGRCLTDTDGGSNYGGVLLGLGLLKERSNSGDGLPFCMQALEWYREKFSSKGNVSSLEAKCAISISRIYLERGQLVPAIKYADMAILIFERTCGSDSPLVASALRVRGDILWAMPEKETRISARETYLKAFRIEAQKDSVDLVALIEINTAIVDTFIKPKVGENSRPEIVRSQFRPVLEIALTASEHARRKCPRDGNLGALFKIFAELAIWAEEFHISKSLLEEANILFSEEKSLDCSHIIQKCNELMKLIDDRDR